MFCTAAGRRQASGHWRVGICPVPRRVDGFPQGTLGFIQGGSEWVTTRWGQTQQAKVSLLERAEEGEGKNRRRAHDECPRVEISRISPLRGTEGTGEEKELLLRFLRRASGKGIHSNLKQRSRPGRETLSRPWPSQVQSQRRGARSSRSGRSTGYPKGRTGEEAPLG